MQESIVTSTPLQSKLRGLRRQSDIFRSQDKGAKNLVSNDDEAERSSLVASEQRAPSTPAGSPRSSRETMTSSPMKQHFQGCLKLYAENKINKDNAWNLQLIDFMTTMIKRHDARMDNLQTASTLVDASSKIYSFRVDALHYDTLKVAGGLTKAAQSKRGKKDENEEAQDEGMEEGQTAAPKKKKKKSKSVIVANPETLNGDFETIDSVDPFFERLAATSGDVTSSNRAFNATLPIDDITYSLMLRTDLPFLKHFKEKNTKIDWKHKTKIPKKLLPAWTDEDQICEPFTGFSISNWDPDNEENIDPDRVNNWVEENRLNLSQQALAIDVNAEVEPIPMDEPDNDLLEDEPLGGLESEEEADVAVAACIAKLPTAPLARITDMRPTQPQHSRLEYSYSTLLAAWAGPTHWRLKNNRASKPDRTHSTTDKITDENKKARQKRQPDWLEAGLAFDHRKHSAEFEPAVPAKICISRKTLATGHTWNEANYKTPIDRGLDELDFRKLFIRNNVVLDRPRDKTLKEQDSEPITVDEQEYDFNNENDASYCPNTVPENNDWGNEEGAAAVSLHAQAAEGDDNGELGDMLEPPPKIPKIFIPYAMRAKKVDMKQLKHCSWKILTEQTPPGEKEDVSETTFFNLYSKLPSKLSTNTREALSVPLALLSVLHLANEKGLVLEKCEDLKDFKIIGLID